MKKIFIASMAILACISPVFVHAQTVDISAMTRPEILAYLDSLVQQLEALEQELNAMEAASAPTPQIVATSTDATGGSTESETTSSVDTSVPEPIMQTKTISVSFNRVGEDGFVTITNDSGVSVRVKNLSVDGTLAGITIGKTYGEGYVYAQSFTDSTGKTFEALTCDGLGSLGKAVLPGNSVDPCRRKDANVAVNELNVGEQMILRYTGDPAPTGVTYQPGSVVEVESGNDVTF